jgi:hypothetical protein
VHIFDLAPAKVAGNFFVPGERVRVTLRAGTSERVRTTRAGARGSFTVSFGRLPERDRCGRVSVTAVGAHGERASFRLPLPACPVMASGPFR